jgi:hypothetical protein
MGGRREKRKKRGAIVGGRDLEVLKRSRDEERFYFQGSVCSAVFILLGRATDRRKIK